MSNPESSTQSPSTRRAHERRSGSGSARLPRALAPFVDFAGLLRVNGFTIGPEQTQTFIQAVGVLGPRSMRDIYRAAVATLAPPIERREAFDALYRQVFLGHTLEALERADGDDDVQAFDERDGSTESIDAVHPFESGARATRSEQTGLRQFDKLTDDDALRRLRRLAPERLPRRLTVRRRSATHGNRWHIRRSLREAVRRDGEVLQIPRLARKSRQRRVVVLIDVSGSMKAQTQSYLRFAHALSSSSDRLEAFTLGTRLTRVSRALRLANESQALATVGALVSDWDGGTRLGDALHAFLSIPRFAGFTRGALVLVLSDGLERGDPVALVQAVQRIRRLCWQLVWLTPLAADWDIDQAAYKGGDEARGRTGRKHGGTTYRPSTDAMLQVLPYLDRLGNAASITRLCDEVLDLSRSLH